MKKMSIVITIVTIALALVMFFAVVLPMIVKSNKKQNSAEDFIESVRQEMDSSPSREDIREEYESNISSLFDGLSFEEYAEDFFATEGN